MFDADDVRSGGRVPAKEASHGVPYRCPVCRNIVKLRRQRGRRLHFAHVVGQASPDCIRYTQERLSWAEKISPHPASPLPTFRLGKLHFGFGPRGAEVAVELPTMEEPYRTGTVTLVGADYEVPIDLSKIGTDFRAPLPLAKAPFSIQTSPDVPLEFDQLLRHSRLELQESCVLFHAHAEHGRRLSDTEVVEAGTALWGVMTAGSDDLQPIPSSVIVEPVGRFGTKDVVSILLPRTYDSDELTILGDWLGNRVEAPAVRVWIEHPLPMGRDPAGVWKYDDMSAEYAILADGPANVSIHNRLHERHSCQLERFDNTWKWKRPEFGEWILRCDGRDVLAFDLLPQTSPPPPLLDVQLNSVPAGSLYSSEQELRAGAITRKHRVLSIRVRSAALASFISVNGINPRELVEHGQVDLLLEHGIIVEAGNFGRLTWSAPASKAESAEVPASITHLAQWLLSVSSRVGKAPAITFPRSAVRGPALEALRTRCWDFRFQPHVNLLLNMIRSLK